MLEERVLRPTVCDCGHPPTPTSHPATGFGTGLDGKTYCYACCAERDRQHMIDEGKITLYLTVDRAPTHTGVITNWPGSLTYACWVRKGRHNLAGTRYDAWFMGPDQHWWHGVTYGDNTDLCHCKRTKNVYA